MTDTPDAVTRLVVDRRQFLLGALGGVGALVLGGCGGSEDGGAGGRPTVRMVHGAVGFPSPFAANGGPGYNQMILLYDTLLWKDGSGELLPWLARSVTSSDDHLTYTFELRQNVKWSDGRDLTADDVVFTFDYYARIPTVPPPVIGQPPRGIASVTASGPTTVAIRLGAPDVTFPAQVAGTIPILPKHIWDGIADPPAARDVSVLVGSGPYRLTSPYNGDTTPLLYEANDGY
ncbi:MAG TPA: ABC transporter substrate-binding protein, partial [Acidimicrobiales bacterium]|nr:ABC transporter substrate-binding protein [Acidimicrobiales bacterium]